MWVLSPGQDHVRLSRERHLQQLELGAAVVESVHTTGRQNGAIGRTEAVVMTISTKCCLALQDKPEHELAVVHVIRHCTSTVFSTLGPYNPNPGQGVSGSTDANITGGETIEAPPLPPGLSHPVMDEALSIEIPVGLLSGGRQGEIVVAPRVMSGRTADLDHVELGRRLQYPMANMGRL